MKKHSYPSDLTDSQWEKIAQFFDTKRSRKYPMRQVCNAIIYVVKTGVSMAAVAEGVRCVVVYLLLL
jgi:transposase